uniref:Uncharacterized protein n=1 Tax=Schistosoma japonicum TaxID=6182 RepID=Q5C0D5_SCHJA|nr:unknown [Schistosoma japonicum]
MIIRRFLASIQVHWINIIHSRPLRMRNRISLILELHLILPFRPKKLQPQSSNDVRGSWMQRLLSWHGEKRNNGLGKCKTDQIL